MMNNRQKKLLADISAEAVRLDWEEAFDGKSYGNKHLFRVNKISEFLCKSENSDEFISLVGAWIHDVSLSFGSDDYDAKYVEKVTRKFLMQYDLKDDELDKILECAVGHEDGFNELSLEAKVVHDADVVDKSGMLGVIRHIWKMTNLLENRILDSNNDLQSLKSHLKFRESKLFFKESLRLVKKLNKDRDSFFSTLNLSAKVVNVVSKMAYDGKTSDQIALFLVSNYNHKFSKNLNNQLKCSFLNNIE